MAYRDLKDLPKKKAITNKFFRKYENIVFKKIIRSKLV